MLIFFLFTPMRCLLRRVSDAQVLVENQIVGQISAGLLIYIGIQEADSPEDLGWIIKKIVGIRIFEDETGQMKSPVGADLGILVVSQFTLFGNLKKGGRPSFHRAAPPQQAEGVYNDFVIELKKIHPGPVENGVFGADMRVVASDDGPVTIWLDSRNKNY